MHLARYSFFLAIGCAPAGCTQGIDTISPDSEGGSLVGGTGGRSTTSTSTGSSGSVPSGNAGSTAAGTGGDGVIAGAGGDFNTGGGGATGAGGAVMAGGSGPIEAGADVRADAPPSTGPAAYWKLDEAAGTTAADSSGHNHAATLTGSTWVTGKVGAHAASFNGTSSYGEAAGPVVDTSKPYTVAAWVQLTTVTGFRTAVSIDGAAVSAFFLQLRGDSGVRFGFSALPADAPGAATFAIAQASPAANTWYHIAGVFDGASLKLYVNGALQETKPFATAWAGTGQTAIGRGFYGGGRADFWPGLIDEVRFYNGALNDAEIASIAAP